MNMNKEALNLGQPVSLHTAQRLAICIHPCNLPKRGSHAIIERLPNRHTQVTGLGSKYINTP